MKNLFRLFYQFIMGIIKRLNSTVVLSKRAKYRKLFKWITFDAGINMSASKYIQVWELN
jgi:hypothetical protein